MHRLRLGALILAIAVLAATTTVYAVHYGEFFKTNGIAAGITKYGSELNQRLDDEMRDRGIPTQETTKVVPLVDIDIGRDIDAKRANIGVAQVAGPADAVKKVQAVASYNRGAGVILPSRVLVPVDNLEPWKNLRRVVGVGVSVIVYVDECNAWPTLPRDGCR